MGDEVTKRTQKALLAGIVANNKGQLSLLTRKIEDCDRAFLKQHLPACIAGASCSKAGVPMLFARTLGFACTGPKIEEVAWSLMRSLVRSGLVEVYGCGDGAVYRKAKR